MEATSSSTDDGGLILKGSKKDIHFNIELQDHWQMDESHVCGLSDCEFQPTNHGVRLDHPNRIENRNTFRYNYQKKLRKQFASIPRGWNFCLALLIQETFRFSLTDARLFYSAIDAGYGWLHLFICKP